MRRIDKIPRCVFSHSGLKEQPTAHRGANPLEGNFYIHLLISLRFTRRVRHRAHLKTGRLEANRATIGDMGRWR
jgi:hypothetical protein